MSLPHSIRGVLENGFIENGPRVFESLHGRWELILNTDYKIPLQLIVAYLYFRANTNELLDICSQQQVV